MPVATSLSTGCTTDLCSPTACEVVAIQTATDETARAIARLAPAMIANSGSNMPISAKLIVDNAYGANILETPAMVTPRPSQQ